MERWFHATPNKARTCPTCRQNPLVSDDEFAEAEVQAEARQVAEARHSTWAFPVSLGGVPAQVELARYLSGLDARLESGSFSSTQDAHQSAHQSRFLV